MIGLMHQIWTGLFILLLSMTPVSLAACNRNAGPGDLVAVNFTDPQLEKYIRTVINKPDGQLFSGQLRRIRRI